MQQIVLRTKTYEFRKRLYPSTVIRIWFYETSPISAITYICDIDSAHIRGVHGRLPEETGIGNKEFNLDGEERGKDWIGYDYAYGIKSCYKLIKPISLGEMKVIYGINGAPRGMVYVTGKMREDVRLEHQECIWKE